MGIDPTRRLSLAAITGMAALLLHRRSAAAPIAQPAEAGPAAFIGRAFELRELAVRSGDQPYGAVVVLDGRIVGEAPSRVVTGTDPSAHAEMEAIRDAARRLGRHDLGGAVLYSSARPCPMCESAASFAGIAAMVHGRNMAEAGRPRLGGC